MSIRVDAKDGRLSCEVRGEVEDDGDVLIIGRVHVTHKLRAGDSPAVRDAMEPVHGVYAEKCQVYRSLIPAFPIASSVEMVAE